MTNRYDRRRRVRRFDELRQETLDRRIERRFDAMIDAYNEGDYAEVVRQADAVVDAAEQGAELSDR